MLEWINELPQLLPAVLFYAFSAALLIAGTGVVLARNPVYAVLLLIFCFFNAAGLFVLLGAEFIAMLTVIVYVGAVAVLFLFVVMMLDIKTESLKAGFSPMMPVGVLLAVCVAAQILGAAFYGPASGFKSSAEELQATASAASAGALPPGGPELAKPSASPEVKNTESLGLVLYTDYLVPFQLSGMALFVAMIGAITLTLHHRPGSKRQSIAAQNARTRSEGVALMNPETGAGV